MGRKRAEGIFTTSNSLRVLGYLAEHPGEEFLSSEVQQETRLSRAGAYLALKNLVGRGFAVKKERGRFHLFAVDHANPLVKQFKVLKNVASLEPLLLRLRPQAVKIVLFGSAGRGEDTFGSDLDLFILTRDPETAAEVLASFTSEKKIQPVVLTPAERPDFEQKERIFCGEIDRGIVLWEETDGAGIPGLPEEREDPAVLQRKSARVKGVGGRRVRSPKGGKNLR
jgi:predicted nucleotidyltransferase